MSPSRTSWSSPPAVAFLRRLGHDASPPPVRAALKRRRGDRRRRRPLVVCRISGASGGGGRPGLPPRRCCPLRPCRCCRSCSCRCVFAGLSVRAAVFAGPLRRAVRWPSSAPGLLRRTRPGPGSLRGGVGLLGLDLGLLRAHRLLTRPRGERLPVDDGLLLLLRLLGVDPAVDDVLLAERPQVVRHPVDEDRQRQERRTDDDTDREHVEHQLLHDRGLRVVHALAGRDLAGHRVPRRDVGEDARRDHQRDHHDDHVGHRGARGFQRRRTLP